MSIEMLTFIQSVGPYGFGAVMGVIIVYTYVKVDARRRINKDIQQTLDAEFRRRFQAELIQNVRETRAELNEQYKQSIKESTDRERLCNDRMSAMEADNEALEKKIDDLQAQVTQLMIEREQMRRQINDLLGGKAEAI